MRLLDFTTVAPREIAPGYLGRYVHSDHITQGRVDIAPGAVIPDHSHLHEQWTLLLSGSLELTVSGVTHVLQPGQMLHIAPPHPEKRSPAFPHPEKRSDEGSCRGREIICRPLA